ncbi:hypothetical protein F5Y09DRAFT_318078 [Xylaria sp. FL1042]|nr:hypothetical protein F5Y09DRAFT_318078 [Xylaria sp. FL1042]
MRKIPNITQKASLESRKPPGLTPIYNTFAILSVTMSLPIDGSQNPPPYTSRASPCDQHSSSSSINPRYNHRPPPRLAPWQRRWNVEWLNKAMIPNLKYRYLRLQRPRNVREGVTRERIDALEDRDSGIIAEMIGAGFVSKENAHKRTRLHCALRRYAWPLQLISHEFKAFKQCWYEFKNKDKLYRVTVVMVMEEQGENPRWKAEMTFAIQPKQFEQMAKEGQWIEFPSPENIKWLYVTEPNGIKRLHATDQKHWGPNLDPATASLPFEERNGHIVRHPVLWPLTRNFHPM